MENQHYKSYEQAALDILRGNKPEEAPVQQKQEETSQPLSEAEVHPDALHVKPVKVNGQTKYKVHAVGSNFSSGIKPGEHLSDSELDDFSEMGGRIKHMKEEAEELDEMGPGKLPRIDKKVENEYGDKLMKDFLAKGGQVQQVKSPALPKNRNRMVARGSLSGAERTITRSGGKSYTSRMEEVEEDYDQLIEEMNAFEIELPEQLTFADYLKAAKVFTESYDDAIVVADYFFRKEDESLVIESFTRSDIEDRVKMHQKAGNETTLPKYGMKNGKPYAEYTVTEKDSGRKTKYIHHGTSRRVERMN